MDNRIIVDGNNNIILQDASGKSITLNQTNIYIYAKNEEDVITFKKILNLQTEINNSEKNIKITNDDITNNSENTLNVQKKVAYEEREMRDFQKRTDESTKLFEEINKIIESGEFTSENKYIITNNIDAISKFKAELENEIVNITSENPNLSSNINFSSGNYSINDIEAEQKAIEEKIRQENKSIKIKKAKLLELIEEYNSKIKEIETDQSELKRVSRFFDEEEFNRFDKKVNLTKQQKENFKKMKLELEPIVTNLITKQETFISDAKTEFSSLKELYEFLLKNKDK